MQTARYLFAAALFANVAFTSAQAVGVASNFAKDADGWYVSDFSGSGRTEVNWIAGVIQTDDRYPETSFHAPAKFTGDWSSLYGSTLSFDLTEVGRDVGADAYYTAIIASGSNVLYWYGGAPSTVFKTFVAPLTASDTRWRLGGTGFAPDSGVAPTAEQFKGVLAGVTRLQVNAEFVTAGSDDTRLDNVILGPVPEPEAYAMLLAGLGLLGVVARRRKGTRG